MLRRLLLSAAGAEEPRRARMAKGGVTGRERAHEVRSERPERQGLVPTGADYPLFLPSIETTTKAQAPPKSLEHSPHPQSLN
jgi:hypothetical protein